MNKAHILSFLFFVGLVACDTATNVEPTADKYFLKYYGQTGDQEGVDVKETADGGFIIGGNSVPTFGGTSDYLLIKTDAEGNQEWQKTYDFGGDDRMTKVLVESGGYLIAGTSAINGSNKIKLLRVELDGVKQSDYTYDSTNVYSYKCNDISVTSLGEFFVVGTYEGTVNGKLGGNSVQIALNNDLTERDHKENGKGVSGGNLVFVKGIEVTNNFANGSTEPNFLVFGYSQSGTQVNLELYQSDQFFGELFWGITPSYSVLDSKIVDVTSTNNGGYMTLLSTDTGIILNEVRESAETKRYFYTSPSLVNLGSEVVGIGITKLLNDNYVISANVNELNSDQTSSSVFETNAVGTITWDKLFGTSSSFTSGNSCVLADGSIVYTGNAGLESETKVFLIKMKSNGEMK